LCGKPGRCINFPTTHSVSCPLYHLGTLLSPFCPLALLLPRESKTTHKKIKIIKSHKVTYTRITFFPLYPTTIKLTTQQQPKEREKREREREKNK
jgi:hypothetical protein